MATPEPTASAAEILAELRARDAIRQVQELEAAEAAPVDRCARCLCSDCGGRLDEHTETGCHCEDCTAFADVACTRFLPEQRVGFIAEQLGPLLSSHLNERARRRCVAVAHAAHHALYDYDQRMGASHGG